jgi:hypothetical protein
MHKREYRYTVPSKTYVCLFQFFVPLSPPEMLRLSPTPFLGEPHFLTVKVNLNSHQNQHTAFGLEQTTVDGKFTSEKQNRAAGCGTGPSKRQCDSFFHVISAREQILIHSSLLLFLLEIRKCQKDGNLVTSRTWIGGVSGASLRVSCRSFLT